MTITQPAAPTNADGVTTGTVTSTEAGVRFITAHSGGTVISQLATVIVEPALAQPRHSATDNRARRPR
jgi:hypothetical protein